MAADARGSHQGLAAGDGQAPQDITRIMLRPLASSLPVGFFAFGVGTVLPLGRRGRARTSLEGGLDRQLHRAESEAGVRRQL